MHHQRTSQSPLHPCAMTSPSRSCLHLVPSSRTAPEQHPQCPMVEVSLCCAQHQRRQACRPPTRPAAAPTPPAALAMPCKPYNMRATRICVHPETRWRHNSYIAFGARPALASARSASSYWNSSIIHSYTAKPYTAETWGMLHARGLIQGAAMVGPPAVPTRRARFAASPFPGRRSNPVQRPVASRTRYAYTYRIN